MSNANNSNKVNPFYISSGAENEWDEWSDDEIDFEEQKGLTTGTTTATTNGHRSYATSGSAIRPDTSKYIAIGALVLFLLALFLGGNNGSNKEVYKSLIDEAPDDDITHLVILGERHSGVPWMKTQLKHCYPHVHVTTSLQRIGYFFQDDERSQRHPSLVVHLVLNVYDWLEQMRQNPEYAPNHHAPSPEDRIVPLEWNDFLTKPWTMDARPGRIHQKCVEQEHSFVSKYNIA